MDRKEEMEKLNGKVKKAKKDVLLNPYAKQERKAINPYALKEKEKIGKKIGLDDSVGGFSMEALEKYKSKSGDKMKNKNSSSISSKSEKTEKSEKSLKNKTVVS